MAGKTNVKFEAIWFPEAGHQNVQVKGEVSTDIDDGDQEVDEDGGEETLLAEKGKCYNSEVDSSPSDGGLPVIPAVCDQVYKCDVCHNQTKYHRGSKRRSVKSLDGKIHECDICLQRFKEKSSLVTHYFQHLKDGLYECPTCQEHFYTRGLLKRHSATHLEDQYFVCDACRKRFGYQSNFVTDLTRRDFVCSICSARFQHNIHLKSHQLRFHNRSWERPKEEQKEQCHVCHALVSRGWLKFHMFKHEIRKKALK
ncbi:myoneurin [Anabrus simplex]|uniref:myoneurin n=1 Tax=Anabrus simplex TaxID=316456 RepID=UPI0035A30A97